MTSCLLLEKILHIRKACAAIVAVRALFVSERLYIQNGTYCEKQVPCCNLPKKEMGFPAFW